MTSRLQDLLSTSKGRSELDRLISDLLRSQDFTGAEQYLTAELRTHPSHITDVCLALPADVIAIEGWDELNAEIERVSNVDKPCTALGIDISNYNDATDQEPGIECAYYSDADTGFPFSTASRADILARNASYGTPWMGNMSGMGESWQLSCRGLNALNRALLAYQKIDKWRPTMESRQVEPAPVDHVAYVLGQWFLHMRFQQAITAGLAARGLSRQIPVLIGAHDVGPWIESVYFVDKVADHHATTARLMRERSEKARADYDRHTEETVEQLKFRRNSIRTWSWFRNRKQRRTFIEYCELQDQLLVRIYDSLKTTIVSRKASWKMSDGEFETFIAQYRQAREARASN